MKKNLHIAIVGAGNVATHLGKKLHTKFSKDISKIDKNADVIILAIKDDAIVEVAKKLKLNNKIIIHTSGSVGMEVLKRSSVNYGVLYPLQTFSKKRKIDLDKVPVCIEGSNKRTEQLLFSLGRSISTNVIRINSKQRKAIHLAAVFANNFTNHMYAIAEDILKKEKLQFDLLKPLILETAGKVQEMDPSSAQTGPAKRKDKKIIRQHLKMLSYKKKYRDLYQRISNSIAHSA